MKEASKEQWVEGSLSRKERLAVGASLEDDPTLLSELMDQERDHRTLSALLDRDGEAALRQSILRQIGSGRQAPSWSWMRVAAILAACGTLGVLVGGWSNRLDQNDPNTAGQQYPNKEHVPQGISRGLDQGESLAGLNSEELAAAYHEIEATFRGPRGRRAKQLVVLRWASVDPEGALKFLQEQDASTDIVTLFEAWARLDHEKAWDASEDLETSVRTKAQHHVLAWLATRDPDRFLVLAEDAGGTRPRVWRTAFEQILKRGGDLNPYVENLPKAHRKSALEGIAVALLKDDTKRALAWAEEFGDPQDHTTVLGAIIRHLGQEDPQSAGKILAQHPDAFTDLGKEIVGRLRQEDPFQALSWIQDHITGEERAILYRELFARTARDSDDRIFGMFDQLLEQEGPTVFRRDHRLDDIFWGTSGLDYRKAIEWVQQLPEGIYGHQHMIPSMIFAWSHHDREAAISYVAEIEHPRMRAALNSQIVNNMLSTSQDREATWNFVEGLDKGRHDRDRAKVVSRWSRTDPVAAASRLSAIEGEGARQHAITGLATNWARLSPTNAIAWADGLDHVEQEMAYAQIARTWSGHDSFRSSEWIGKLPQGRLRDLAVEQLVGEVALFEGERSFEWAVTVSDLEVRKRTTRNAVAAWAKQDAAGVRKAIQTSNLSAGERIELLQVANGEGDQR